MVDATPLNIRSPFRHRKVSKRDGSQKFVVAHHMVGNTYPYTQDDWTSDIQAAHAAGIDGFALNIGSDDWQPTQVASAYQAAAASGTDFKLFISFDMSVLPCSSPDDAAALRNYITTYAQHPNQLQVNNRAFASTFAGESCSFGQGSVPQGWSSQFTQHPDLSGANAVHFVPSFFVDPATFGQYNGAMHGAFNFNSGWPIQLTANTGNSVLGPLGTNLASSASQAIGTITQALSQFVGATDTDTQYVNGLKSVTTDDGAPTYMGAVSPWFFTHYGADSYNKNFIYYADSHLYPTRWESIIDNRDMFDMVEIVTWNDFGESHYIGPIHGAQPNSQDWVDGFDHTAWLDMTSYYATAYKTGSYPQITEDKLYMWARPHTKDANAPDPVGKPDNYELDQDVLWAVVFATANSTVTLYTSDSTSQTFNVNAGVNKISTDLTPGGYMRGTIVRNGQTIVDFRPDGYNFTANPQAYNYNAFAAVSPSSAPASN
ncbi:hypothetical protein PHLCEN_2v9527 [Hermanssonia centrifuga]|uniref:Glycoside hydrolase family 71 protein n=1 Tax=Hermanssonia centrifuga TaxID=98765 RepID=A0A2R6NQJ1_9APHY|nr:hypothetical protein PHLCEN_2v9527 [Hermanssonia centrifuga]